MQKLTARLESLGDVDPSIEQDIEDGKNKINLIRQKSEICLSDSHLINGIYRLTDGRLDGHL